MGALKSKSLKIIEQKMQDLPQDTLRYHILESAKNFKTSWVELGRSLYSVWKDKFYKEWGYSNFDLYASKEIGIRKQTAMKLLRSYFFLEKEEPEYLKAEFMASQDTAALPSYESVDLLRLAKGKKTLDSQDYYRLKKDVFEKGKDSREVKKDLTALIRERQELEPEEAYQKRRLSAIRRFLSTLKSLKQELEISKLLPAEIIREASSLIGKLEAEVS
jgi:hypothetical protein